MYTAVVERHISAPRVLADTLPDARARDVLLVLSGAWLTALLAQIAIHVPPSPVPVTGQTLAVVIVGASLGATRGASSLALYLVLGLFLPVYADGTSGPEVVWGATGGYLVGFIAAAWLIGYLAERGADRKPLPAFTAFCLGQLAVFGIGVPWLKVATDMTWADAVHNGFTLFIVGGLIKAGLAGILTPLAWRATAR